MPTKQIEVTPELLRRIRAREGLNTGAMGDRLGVSGRTVESWEQGRRNMPEPVKRLVVSLFLS